MASRGHSWPTAALILSHALSVTASGSIWVFQPDYGPAPPPDKGPPFSFYASRNMALLPYQIVGILGGYVATALVIGILLLTVGRRLRKAAQSSSRSRAKEMVKPSHHALGISPVSPELSVRSWPSPKHIRDSFRKKGEARVTVTAMKPTFDAKVLEEDKVHRQQEMERLYAAVMGQEDQLYAQQAEPEPEHVAQTRSIERTRHISSASFSQPMPPSRSNTVTSTSTAAPRRDIRAIYPPNHQQQAAPALPPPPRSPLTTQYATSPSGSTFSKTSKSGRKHIRGLHISSPIKNYPASNDSEDDMDASTPLSPQFFNSASHQHEHEHDDDAVSDDDADEYYHHHRSHSQTHSINGPRPLPHPAPQRGFSYTSDTPTLNNPPDTYYANTTTTYPPRSDTISTKRSDLPLRALTANAYLTPASPGLTQTTIIEQKHHFAPYGAVNGMWSATQGPPNTAGLAVPLSPYMPFTPITPVTPHLQTKRERKQRGREDVRAAKTEEDDLVADEGDMWGNGYE